MALPQLDENIAQLIITLIVAYIFNNVGKLIAVFRSAKPNRPPKPLEVQDKVKSGLLAILAIASLVALCVPPENYFQIISVNTDSPGYMINKAFKLFMETTYPDTRDYTPDVREYLDNLQILSERLLIDETRKNYLLYGNSVFDCAWCIEPFDYFCHSMSTILFYYLGFVFAMYATCQGWRREHWWSSSLALLTILISSEIFQLYMSYTPFHSHFDYHGTETDFTILWRLRFLVFFLLSFLAFAFPKEGHWSKQDELRQIITRVQASDNYAMTGSYIDHAVANDDELKAAFFKRANDFEAKKAELLKDPEFLVRCH